MIKRLEINTDGWGFARELRYSCIACYDTGVVTIWTPQAIRRAMANPDHNKRSTLHGVVVDGWETCCVRCTCDRAIGDHWGHRERDVPVFGTRLWHIRVGRTEEEVREAKIAAAAFEPVPHYTEFDAFA